MKWFLSVSTNLLFPFYLSLLSTYTSIPRLLFSLWLAHRVYVDCFSSYYYYYIIIILVVGCGENKLWLHVDSEDGASYWDNGTDYENLICKYWMYYLYSILVDKDRIEKRSYWSAKIDYVIIVFVCLIGWLSVFIRGG